MLRRSFLSTGLVIALAGCAGSGTHPRRRDPSSFEPADLVKSDVDRAIEVHHREIFTTLRGIAQKLYRRNPRELRNGTRRTLEQALSRLFDDLHGWRFAELGDRRGLELVQLALRADFAGDRVLALIGGLGGMIQTAFGDRSEFFILDQIDGQNLYNSARNVEIAVWKLSNTADATGAPLLLTNESGPPANLSFEREFGKVIGNLDVLSKLMSARGGRVIVRVAQSMATAVFLPVK